jgi:hypothetical protein
MGEGNENLVYSSPWDFKSSFTCRKILRLGTSSFTSHPRKVSYEFLSPLKVHRRGRVRPRNVLSPVVSTLTTTQGDCVKCNSVPDPDRSVPSLCLVM